MTKANTHKKKRVGPFLASAVFCESVIEDKDGLMTVVKIIDNLTILISQDAPADVPSEANRLPVQINALISFRTGDAPGDHTFRVDIESPSGKAGKAFETVLNCSSPAHGGANVKIKTVIQLKQGGLFWFHLFLDGKRVGRMPLLINIKRHQGSPFPPVPGGKRPAKKPSKGKE